MKNKKLLWCSLTVFAIAALYFSGIAAFPVKAGKRPELTTTPQTLPFSQNWSNAGLITANDDWSGAPGITGYLGNYDTINAPTNVDPRTLSAPFITNDVDVIANQSSVALTNGGVAEFDGITDPVVALNGSGTADAPHIIIYLNTTGRTNINFTCNIRDIDDTVDSSTQQVDVQYRIGGTGNYTSVTGGYIADASSGPSTTMSTPLNLTLPAAADNQAMVEVRVITTNAGGNDEWIGVDDISVTGTATVVNTQHIVDFNGDGRTDWSIVRDVGPGQWYWITEENLAGPGTISYQPWGKPASDYLVPEDFDGDSKTDIAVWRDPLGPGQGAFFILQSQTSTVRAELFGLTGDDPTVARDYDGDGKTDLAVNRRTGPQLFWYYRPTPGGPIFTRQWGTATDFAAPGDYDGDGKYDFAVQRDHGLTATFWFNYGSDAPGVVSRQIYFGRGNDLVVPGDYDGDGKTDVSIVRNTSGFYEWFYEPSSAPGTFLGGQWGVNGTDAITQGDYDGDGKTDFAVWRPNLDPSQNFFLVRRSSDGALMFHEWGSLNDTPVAQYNVH